MACEDNKMKMLANLFQLTAIVAMLYPAYYIWDRDQVDNFCEELNVGMSKHELLTLADSNNVTMLGPVNESIEGGKWYASVSPAVSSDYSCVIKGIGATVATFLIAYN